MTASRGPRHAGRKGGAPVRKSITTRYFYSTAVLLICSIAVMGFIQMYLAMGYFREENGTALIQTIDNAILAIRNPQQGPFRFEEYLNDPDNGLVARLEKWTQFWQNEADTLRSMIAAQRSQTENTLYPDLVNVPVLEWLAEDQG